MRQDTIGGAFRQMRNVIRLRYMQMLWNFSLFIIGLKDNRAY